MHWEEATSGGKTVLLLADKKRQSWKAVASGISECLRNLCSEVERRIEPDAWDRLICEVWLSSGRLIFLPTRRAAIGKPVLIVQFLSSFLQDEFDKLKDERENPNYARGISNLRHRIFQAFGNATEEPPVNLALQELRKVNEFRLFIQFGSDEDTRQEQFVVWQKPKVKARRKQR